MERLDSSDKSIIKLIFDKLYKVIEAVCALCLAAQVVIIFYSVLGRYVLHKSPVWAEEVSRLAMIWMAWLSAALAIKDDTHVRITFLDKVFSKNALFVRDSLYLLLNIGFCGILFYRSIALVNQGSRTRLPASGWPTSILYLSVCLGALAMLLMLVYKLGEKICQRK